MCMVLTWLMCFLEGWIKSESESNFILLLQKAVKFDGEGHNQFLSSTNSENFGLFAS